MGALPYDAYIFDLDGTLTRSDPGILNSVLYALEKMGVTGYKREDLGFVLGPPLMYSFRDVMGMEEEKAYRAIAFFQERYSREGFLENSVYTGIPALLRSLKARGAYLAVATAKPMKFAARVLEAFGLYKYFDAVAAPNDEDETPYKERLLRRALPQWAKKACMVGDKHLDIKAARDCAITGVGVLYGYGTRQEFEEAGAHVVVDTVEDLTRHLLGDNPLAPGRFITMEGSDGCGKSTQMAYTKKMLEDMGHQVITTREPGGCPISERIRGIVLDAKAEGMSDTCEALLFAAARAQHVHQVIRPALNEGKVVLCDRFVDSSLVYQGAGRGLGDVVRQVNEPAVDGCWPHITILLSLDPRLAMKRRLAVDAPDRIEKEQGRFVDRVYEAYLTLARENPGRFRVVDADGTPDQVAQRIREILAKEV